MAATFPKLPTLNQLATFGGKTWKWTGVRWEIQGVGRQTLQDYYTSAEVDTKLSNASSIAVSASAPANPANGHLWFNTDTSTLSIYATNEWVQASSSGSGGFSISETVPLDANSGDSWFDSSTAKLYVYYDSSWIEILGGQIGPQGAQGIPGDQGIDGAPGRFKLSESAPENPEPGDAWFDTVSAKFFVYYNSFWVEFGTNNQGEPGVSGQDGVASATSPLAYDPQSRTISIDLSSYATTQAVSDAIAELVSSAPDTLDTLNELAAALADDPNFATTIASSIAEKAPSENPTFTGTVSLGYSSISAANNTYLGANNGGFWITSDELVLPTNTSIGLVSATELGYLNGTTSGIQAQIDAKASASHTHTKSQIIDFSHTHNATEITTAVSDRSANYTLVPGDRNSYIRSTGSAITITVPDVLANGESVNFIQAGTGQITFAGSGITIYSADSKLLTAKQYAGATITKAGGSYYLIGNLA